MKKRLICFLILSSFVIGLVFVGSCKDYDDFALDIRVQNLEIKGDSTRGLMYDSLAAIRKALGNIKECNCDPTLKRKIDSLYNYLGEVLNTTISIDTAPGQAAQGLGKIINYLNRQLNLMAAQADYDNLKARIDKLQNDSISHAFDTAFLAYEDAKWVADSLRNKRFGIGDSIRKAQDTAAMAYAQAKANQDDITKLKKRDKILTDSLALAWDSLRLAWDSIRNHNGRIEALEAYRHSYYDSLRHAVQRADSNKVSIDSLAQVTNDLITEDTRLNKRIDSLAQVTKQDSATLSARIDKLISKDNEHDRRIDSLADVTLADEIQAQKNFVRSLEYADSIGDTIKVELYDSIAKVVRAYQAADDLIREDIGHLYDSVTHAFDSIRAHRDSINNLRDSIRAHRKDLKSLRDSINDHRKEIKLIYDSVVAVRKRLDTLELRIDTLKLRIDTLNLRVDTLNLRVDTLNNRVDTLNLKVDSLKDAKEKEITNIRINGTWNDVFGSFALPVNLRSNILMSYYSDSFSPTQFPKRGSSVLGGDDVSNKDMDVITTANVKNLKKGKIVGESSDNAGRLYFTLNPNDVKIDDTYAFLLRTSNGDTTRVTLSNIKKSTEKLTYGYSSGLFVNGQVDEGDINTDNGFYQADAKIEVDDAYSLRPRIDVDKDEIKAVISDVKHFKNGDVDLKSMASTLKELVINSALKSADGILDANALYVSWDDVYGKHSAVSDYNLAAFAVNPLSYNTFDALSLPEIDIPKNPIQYLINRAAQKAKSETNKITLKFKKIDIDSVSFVLPDVTFKAFDDETDKPIKIYIKASRKGKTVKDTVIVPFDDAYMKIRQPILDALKDIEDVIGILHFNMDSVINEMRLDINKQANDVIASIQDKVKSSIKKGIDELATEVGNNKYVKKLEALATRMSSFYNGHSDGLTKFMVQPILLYQDADEDLHPVSRSMTAATSSGKDIDLIMTSLTNEIVTPAYKKFIAVTNFESADTHRDWQNDNDSAAKDVIDKINAKDGICEVLEGKTKKVNFAVEDEGIYELLLSTVDYDGNIFNRKFYLYVTK